jgi:hypothetical protein
VGVLAAKGTGRRQAWPLLGVGGRSKVEELEDQLGLSGMPCSQCSSRSHTVLGYMQV